MRALRVANIAGSTVSRRQPELLRFRWSSYPNCQFSSTIEKVPPLATLPERVHVAALAISDALTSQGILHAIAGGIACHAFGHRRAADDVEVLVNAEDAQCAVFALLSDSACYPPRFSGSRRRWRDTRNKVDIEVLVSGDFPGDGHPKPVVFPVIPPLGPSQTHDLYTRVFGGLRILGLTTLVELTLASAMTAPHYTADAQALIAANALPRELVVELHGSVWPEFLRLWGLADEQRRRLRVGPSLL